MLNPSNHKQGAIMSKVLGRINYVLVMAVLLTGFALPLHAQGQAVAPACQQTTIDVFTEALIADLAASGFQVSQGCPMVYSLTPSTTCKDYTYPALNTCLGSNPTAPYVAAVVKSWPDEYVDPLTVNAFGPVESGYTPTYRLDPREAIVVYGEMPPPGRYMGMQTWEWSQHGRWKDKDYDTWANMPGQTFPMSLVFSTMPPTDPKAGRVFTFSALGDIINNVVMQRQSGYPFGKNRYFIITPSDTTNLAVRSALQAMGVDDSHIFTEQIPGTDDLGPIGPLGMGKNAIDFITLFRYAIPDPGYENDAQIWRADPPLKVLRVRASDSAGPVKRYGSLTFEGRTAHDETYLEGDMEDLIDALCDRAGSTANLASTDCTEPGESSLMVDPVRDYGWTGPFCRKFNMNCDGDQNDAAYFLSKTLPLDSGQVYAVVGTLATETRNATYVGLGVNDASTFFAPANIGEMTLKGSADGYAATVENTGMFFVHFFTRTCSALDNLLPPERSKDCTEIDYQMVPMEGDTTAPGDPALHGMFQIGLRDYVATGTQRGPDSSLLLNPRILTFRRQ